MTPAGRRKGIWDVAIAGKGAQITVVKTVTVSAYNSLSEAEPLRQRLLEAGIAAEIINESTADKILEFNRVNAGVRIEVPRQHFEKALLITHDWEVEKDVANARALEAIPATPTGWTAQESSPKHS